jgi:segregation and condensation protein A
MTLPTSYTIELPVFQGPLDLLLELIERAELDITRVALAQVTDQYLAYLQQFSEYHLEDLAGFLVIASRLLQIKSEALLPRPPVREPGEEDPGDALARQLIAYKKYKEVATLLSERDEAGLKTYLRLVTTPAHEPTFDIGDLRIGDLRRAMLAVLSNQRQEEALGTVVAAPRVRIRDKIQLVLDTLRTATETSFQKLFRKSKSRLEVVVSFLAVLELIKLRRVSASQGTLFGDIILARGERWTDDQSADLELEFEE